MQQIGQGESRSGALGNHGEEVESLADLAHDARNMVTALSLYCDLLDQPGVLSNSYGHYAGELRLVTGACRQLVEKIGMLSGRQASAGNELEKWAGRTSDPQRTTPLQPRAAAGRMQDAPIFNLEQELRANRNLLDALAGAAIVVTMSTEGGAKPVGLSSEDLTRVLVNLVKNASEAIRGAGTIHIALSERKESAGELPLLVLAVEDSGPGLSSEILEHIFEPGFSTRMGGMTAGRNAKVGWPVSHRGLGLSITRAIVEAGGGRIRAANRNLGGARFEIELPERTR